MTGAKRGLIRLGIEFLIQSATLGVAVAAGMILLVLIAK